MATFRINKTKDFTVMSNTHLRDKQLSLKAKGLLSLMLALPENWNYTIDGLVAICKENETAVKSTLNELKQYGYLIVTKKMPNETADGRFGYEYDIYEQPQGKQGIEKQGVENLHLENQPLENQPQLNTKQLNTKQTNNLIIKDIVEYLNRKAGTAYRATTPATQKHINARLKEGYTLDDFKKVIDNKVADWKGTEMEQYLRPKTLFGTNFESYLNAKIIKPTKGKMVVGGVEIERRAYSDEQLESLFATLDDLEE